MFKLPDLPSSQAEVHELADFVELLCWVRGSTSKREVVAYLGRVDDNDNNIGCDDNEDGNSDFLDEVMNEIERRVFACGVGYPFQLDLEGTVLRYNMNDDGERSIIYLYLLLSTRLNMTKNRVHERIDGTSLFEEVCAHVLKNYLGKTRAKALVFGTAVTESFQDKIKALCEQLCEGSGYKNPDVMPSVDRDGKLDVVAWVPFTDRRAGQLIVFSQCKTGTNWKDHVAQLNPGAFVQKWIDGTIAVTPVRSFCVTEACDQSRWNSACIDAGILLDRCRLVDFCDNIDPTLLSNVNRWTTAAKSHVVSKMAW
ncbi:MAG: hypothetical protein EPO31_15175 [Gammaproteobacteria bacterium]|nr:MAG: hypothetical protein EPO31_15175 [Gammaproteobacteria bacterium]